MILFYIIKIIFFLTLKLAKNKLFDKVCLDNFPHKKFQISPFIRLLIELNTYMADESQQQIIKVYDN